MDNAIGRVTSILSIPYGYTVSLWSAGAHTYTRQGPPTVLDVMSFVVGAVAAFVALARLGRDHLETEIAGALAGCREPVSHRGGAGRPGLSGPDRRPEPLLFRWQFPRDCRLHSEPGLPGPDCARTGAAIIRSRDRGEGMRYEREKCESCLTTPGSLC